MYKLVRASPAQKEVHLVPDGSDFVSQVCSAQRVVSWCWQEIPSSWGRSSGPVSPSSMDLVSSCCCVFRVQAPHYLEAQNVSLR